MGMRGGWGGVYMYEGWVGDIHAHMYKGWVVGMRGGWGYGWVGAGYVHI